MMARKIFSRMLRYIQGYCVKHMTCDSGCIFATDKKRCTWENADCGIPEDWDDLIQYIKTGEKEDKESARE